MIFDGFSYLRLGLNEARKLILKCKKQNGETIFHSKCFPPQLKANWTFKGVNYEIHGNDPTTNTNSNTNVTLEYENLPQL